ncbi:hypothetical protein DFQ05_2246 [Winogradskyella wandonensis]|uniref:Lipoprotein n=1 Tax=Winogradskyella wandonensis TaxID=1442586 RepID=A0A4R1KJW1_9FLAO|nr:hypothetical protein [Winogradskyella wandonensis]TCK65034.1 hypothetical protein DFQ05_2246 [Winogradskyella wandonensis]
MKNNVLSAFVVFFAVVACLLIIDDISHGVTKNDSDSADVKAEIPQKKSENLATLDLTADN